MINNYLIEKIMEERSAVEFFKLKEEIVEALGKSGLSRRLSVIQSFQDFYACKSEIIQELEGEQSNSKKNVLKKKQ